MGAACWVLALLPALPLPLLQRYISPAMVALRYPLPRRCRWHWSGGSLARPPPPTTKNSPLHPAPTHPLAPFRPRPPCRSVGIGCPILPGVMPIMTYGGFKRMTSFCKTAVPQHIADTLEAIKGSDDAVKVGALGGAAVHQYSTTAVQQYFSTAGRCRGQSAPGASLHGVRLLLMFCWCGGTEPSTASRASPLPPPPPSYLPACTPLQAYGISLGTMMCQRLLAAGAPGVHMYTLNLERSAGGAGGAGGGRRRRRRGSGQCKEEEGQQEVSTVC